jgi:hypothetical protein
MCIINILLKVISDYTSAVSSKLTFRSIFVSYDGKLALTARNTLFAF